MIQFCDEAHVLELLLRSVLRIVRGLSSQPPGCIALTTLRPGLVDTVEKRRRAARRETRAPAAPTGEAQASQRARRSDRPT